jgi:hypothetical protein
MVLTDEDEVENGKKDDIFPRAIYAAWQVV